MTNINPEAGNSAKTLRRNSSGLRRDLEILEVLGSPMAEAAGGLGVGKVAQLTSRDKGQISRTLATLAEAGLVSRDADSLDYRLGHGLYALAARTAESHMVRAATPFLKKVSAATHETVHLCVLRGGTVLTLKSEMSNHTYRAMGWEGVSVDAWGTSSGRVLVSDWDIAALHHWYETHASGEHVTPPVPPLVQDSGRTIFPAKGKIKIRTFEDFILEIRAIRHKGYAVVDEEFEPGVVGVSAPVFDFRQRVVGALNVSAPKQRLGEHLEQAGALTARVADEFSEALGHHHSSTP